MFKMCIIFTCVRVVNVDNKYFIFDSIYSFIVARFYFQFSTSGNISSNVVNYAKHLFSINNYFCPEIIFSLFSTVIVGQSK